MTSFTSLLFVRRCLIVHSIVCFVVLLLRCVCSVLLLFYFASPSHGPPPYPSQVAPQLLLELLKRVEMARALDRKRVTLHVVDRFSLKLAAGLPTTRPRAQSHARFRKRLSRQGSKLLKLTGQTESQRISTAVSKYVGSVRRCCSWC